MKNYPVRLLRLAFGLFLYALGIVVTMKGNIGYAPWDVFHAGIAKTTGISIGTASILVGILIGVLTALLGEKLGLVTLGNMVLIGLMMDLLLDWNLIPLANSFFPGLLMMIAGLFIIALASYFYIGSGFGAGPRDSLMVALTRKTQLPVGLCRASIELLVLLIGWKLGGLIGLGTVISALTAGFCVQITFHLLRFNVVTVRHETLSQTFTALFGGK
ncbi:MAG: hypothetical protein LLG09_05200 [Negativicutes bacterium]|nr:hypothetical protein [Negativicutes bacterium]